MEFKSTVEDLLPIRLRFQVVKCQNALRFYIRLHQTNVEKLDWAENAEAKRNIIMAEQKMHEINVQQKKILKKIDMILENYCKKLTEEGSVFDRDIIYGTANRLISKQLEKTVQKERNSTDARLRAALVKKFSPAPNQVSLLKQRRDIPSKFDSKRTPPRGSFRFPTKIISPQINNSRMNLLEALKKAKVEVKDEKEEANDDDDDDDTDSESPTKVAPHRPISANKKQNGNNNIEKKVKEETTVAAPVVVESFSRRRRKAHQTNLIDEPQPALDTSSESNSEKSSRRSSIEEIYPKQPTTIEELGQGKFLKIFNLLTHEELKEYQTRRVSRRRRNCTSTNRKDFHYGNYDPEPIRLHSSRPVLYSPPAQKEKRKFLQPIAKGGARPKLISSIQPTSVTIKKHKTEVVSKQSSRSHQPKTTTTTTTSTTDQQVPTRDLKSCIACTRLEDIEKMNACLWCYNFYHLNCHVLQQRDLRERENSCPLCLKRIVDKKKRQAELNKDLKFKVLNSQHKARIMQARQKLVLDSTTAT